jgi:hypothetical protein
MGIARPALAVGEISLLVGVEGNDVADLPYALP